MTLRIYELCSWKAYQITNLMIQATFRKILHVFEKALNKSLGHWCIWSSIVKTFFSQKCLFTHMHFIMSELRNSTSVFENFAGFWRYLHMYRAQKWNNIMHVILITISNNNNTITSVISEAYNSSSHWDFFWQICTINRNIKIWCEICSKLIEDSPKFIFASSIK